jgi:hypothetical protein
LGLDLLTLDVVGMLFTPLAVLAHGQFFLHLFLVALGVVVDPITVGAFEFGHEIFDSSHR